EAARQQLIDSVTPITGTETLPLLQAFGRVLAQSCQALIDVPPEANSAMDGFAINSAEIKVGTCPPVSERMAGGGVARPLLPGTAPRILTGAVVPAGADAGIIQEDCRV